VILEIEITRRVDNLLKALGNKYMTGVLSSRLSLARQWSYLRQIIARNIAGMFGAGLFGFAVFRSRLLAHNSFRFVQQAWDAIAGTYGVSFNFLSFLSGASAYALLWLLSVAVLLLRKQRPTAQYAILHSTTVLGPAALLGVPGLLAFLGGPMALDLSCVVAALLVLWIVARALIRAGDVQPYFAASAGCMNSLFCCLLAFCLVATSFVITLGAVYFAIHGEETDNGMLPRTAYVLSFDTEEDWCGGEDAARMIDTPCRSFYVESYKYITSGAFQKLVQGLADRHIPATFYCTPNFAKDNPGIVQELERLDHEIAVHLHMHNVQDVAFPYHGGDEDMLSTYSSSTQARAILQAKQDIEDVTGHSVYSFRSGGWSCDPGVENACARAGFKSISNHVSTYFLPSGVWQIATATQADILRSPVWFWRSLKWDNKHKLIPLFSHPMVLFDHAANRPREAMLQTFFKELDDFRHKYPDIHFMTTTAASSLLKYKPPRMLVRMTAGTLSILLIAGCLIVSAQGRGANSPWHTKGVDNV